MYYDYNTPKGKVKTFISYSDYNNSVTIYEEDLVETSLLKEESGEEYFKHNGEKIPFTSFERHSMAELKKRYENHENVDDCELMIAIICDGMANVRFEADMPVPDTVIPMMGIAICSDKTKKCICKLIEDYLSMPHEEYKLKLTVAEEDESFGAVCSDRYYVSSFGGMLATGRMKILDSIDDGKTADEHINEYFAKVNRKFSMEMA